MAFSRKVMRGIRRRMAQKRATRRNQQKLLQRAGNPKGRVPSPEEQKRIREDEASKQRRTSRRANPNLTGVKQATLARNPRTLSSEEQKQIREALKKAQQKRKSIDKINSANSSERDRLNKLAARANDPIRTGAKHSGQGRGGRGGIPSVKPIKGRGPRMIVDPKRPSTSVPKHSGEGKGGQGGIPSVKPIKGRGPRMIVDPKRPTTTRAPTPVKGRGPRMIVDPKRPSTSVPKGHSIMTPVKNDKSTTKILSAQAPIPRSQYMRGAKHSGQGRGRRGGIPDVKAPLQPRQARLANPRGVRPYFKGGNVTPTKNAIGTNDYRKTGTTLSVKDNRKKTK